MDQKWILALVILVVHHKVTSGAYKVETPAEGRDVDIKCDPNEAKGTMVIWFRVLDKTRMEFIASVTNNGLLKTPKNLPSKFRSKFEQHTLTVVGFEGDKDAGIYGCASLVGGNQLRFGDATRVNAREVPVPKPAVVTPKPTQVIPTTTPCACNRPRAGTTSMACSLIILAPLAGGCGLLLLLLIIITLYCNKIRTRRCPHHYKRKNKNSEMSIPLQDKTTDDGTWKQMRPNSRI